MTTETKLVTQSILKQLFDYDPTTGYLTWSKNHVKQNYIGKRAGFMDNYNGYRVIHSINGKKYREHRIIWMWHNGEFPKEQLDHINGIRDDNRIENLRECTNKQNSENRTVHSNKNKTSKYIGVQHRGNGVKVKPWRARIMHNMKNISLGYFETEEEAYQAYVEAKAKYHSFSPIVNIKDDPLTTI